MFATTIFYEIRGRYIASLTKGLPTTQGNGIWGRIVLGTVLARTQVPKEKMLKDNNIATQAHQ